jgi:hypothetical protein
MGTDLLESSGRTLVMGNNFHINLQPDTRAETDRLFRELGEGGAVTVPLQVMFWGDYFGCASAQASSGSSLGILGRSGRRPRGEPGVDLGERGVSDSSHPDVSGSGELRLGARSLEISASPVEGEREGVVCVALALLVAGYGARGRRSPRRSRGRAPAAGGRGVLTIRAVRDREVVEVVGDARRLSGAARGI